MRRRFVLSFALPVLLQIPLGAGSEESTEPAAGVSRKAPPAHSQTGWCEPSLDFRIFNWNVSGSDENWNLGKDRWVADYIVHQVTVCDANVITLQEVTPLCLQYVADDLPGWEFHSDWFDHPNDLIAVCVKGAATNFVSKRLCDAGSNFPDPSENPPPYWWGYVQVEYQGELITSVHTRSAWKSEHVSELHEDIGSGIISGDFNYVDATVNPAVPYPCNPASPTNPQSPDWYQTDLDLEWTLDGYDNQGVYFQHKIDHVLTVEEPRAICGDAIGDGSEWFPPVASAHRALLGGVSLRHTWVDFHYVGVETGSFGSPFNTLAEAVQVADHGGTIRIKSGTSGEVATIDSSVALDSYGGTAVIGH